MFSRRGDSCVGAFGRGEDKAKVRWSLLDTSTTGLLANSGKKLSLLKGFCWVLVKYFDGMMR